MRKLTAISGLPFVASLLLLLVGCNSRQPGESTSTALPTLSIGDGQNNDANPPADGNPNRPATGSNARAAQGDPQIEAIVGQVRDNYQAWRSGRPYDFRPVAAEICQRLASQFDQSSAQLANSAGQVFVMTENYEIARQVYTALKDAAARAGNTPLGQSGSEIAQAALLRLSLVGSSPNIQGSVLGGGTLDWNAYRGKVVLLDFWATWCKYCVEELPDVKAVYEKLHDRDFEVVGISLDDNQQQLAEFVTQRKLPWVMLFETNPAKQGWEVPLVKQFGIEELPTLMLINRAGKIVSISARGEDLEAQVEKLLAERP
jgi:peroxiredoxin